MEGHAITFERLQVDFGLGRILSIDVDHSRRRLFVVADPMLVEECEGQTVRQVGHHSVDGSEVQRG